MFITRIQVSNNYFIYPHCQWAGNSRPDNVLALLSAPPPTPNRRCAGRSDPHISLRFACEENVYTCRYADVAPTPPRARNGWHAAVACVCARVHNTPSWGGGGGWGHLLVSSGPDTAIVISGRCDRVIVDYGCSTAAFTPCSLHTKHTRRAYAYKHTHPCPFRPSSVY